MLVQIRPVELETFVNSGSIEADARTTQQLHVEPLKHSDIELQRIVEYRCHLTIFLSMR